MTTAILSLLTGLSATDTQLLQSAPTQSPSATGDTPTALTALPAQSLHDKIGLFQSLLSGEQLPGDNTTGTFFTTALQRTQTDTNKTADNAALYQNDATTNTTLSSIGEQPIRLAAEGNASSQKGLQPPLNIASLPYPEAASLLVDKNGAAANNADQEARLLQASQGITANGTSNNVATTPQAPLTPEITATAETQSLSDKASTSNAEANTLPPELPPNPQLTSGQPQDAASITQKPLLAQGAAYSTQQDSETLNNLISRFARSQGLHIQPEAAKPLTPKTTPGSIATFESMRPASSQTAQAANLQAASLTRETQPTPELTTQIVRLGGQKEALTVKDTPVIQPYLTQNQPSTPQTGAGQNGTPTIPSPVSLVAAPQSDSAFPSSLPSHADGAAQLPLGLSNTPIESASAKEPSAYTQQQTFAQKTPAEQLQMQIAKAVKDGSHNITIQLEPQSLGKVDIRMDIGVEGRLHMTMLVDRPETLDLLRNDARSLERALNEAGLKTDSSSLSFDLRGQQQQQFGQEKQGQYGQFSLNQNTETTESLLQELVAAETKAATHYGYSGDGALDITV